MEIRRIILMLCFVTSFSSFGFCSKAFLAEVAVKNHGDWLVQNGVTDLGFGTISDTIRVQVNNCTEIFNITCGNPMMRALSPYEIVGGEVVSSEDIFGKKCWNIQASESTVQLYFKLSSKYKRAVPFSVQSLSDSISERNLNYLMVGLYLGLVSLISLINLGCYIITRERQFRNYIIMLFTVFLAQLAVIGFGADFIENLFNTSESNFVVLAANLSVFGSLFFAYFFIDNSPHRRLFRLVSLILISVSCLSLTFLFIGETTLAYRILDVNNMCAAVLILFFAFFSIEHSSRDTAIFFLGWCIFCLGAICFMLKDLGVLPWNSFTQYCMIFASGIETIIVSLAIGYKFFLIQQAHYLSQQSLDQALLDKATVYESLQSSNQNNLLLQMELNQAKLNPHFISNCLNGISSIISMGNTIDARKYIIRFGRLMRGLLHKDSQDRILLYEECILLHSYCSMEQFRTMNKFEIRIDIEENNDLFDFMIPKMAIQPLVENSILHGLSHLTTRQPTLHIKFKRLGESLIQVIIEDNGVGRKESAIRNQSNRDKHVSVGIQLITERLKLLMKKDSSFEPFVYEDLIDDKHNALGTRAILTLPHYPYPHNHPKRGDNPFKTGFNFQLTE